MRILLEWQGGRAYAEDLLARELTSAALSSPDRGLCHELVYGIIRQQSALDWLIARKTDGRTQKQALRVILQLGLYQIFWLDRIPHHAAVDTTVQLARESGLGPQSGFVNAVLRGYIRERDPTTRLLADFKESDPAIGYSHPGWLCERWQKQWGSERTTQLMEWNNTPPITYARVNRLKTNDANLCAAWNSEGVKFDRFNRDWTGNDLVFRLDSHPPLTDLPSFKEGLFYVQDPSTLLAVNELNPQPGETILDFCAAPGGKTTFMAQLMQNRGRIFAHDASEERLKLVRENCERLGVTCVETALASQQSSVNDQNPMVDRVLVDAPCSNTGVMRRRVDLRWRIRPEEIQRLKSTQGKLLGTAAPLLRPGGTLVYSTCSLEPEENAGVVNQFLATNPSFKLINQRELLPFNDGVDGAYVAKMLLTSD